MMHGLISAANEQAAAAGQVSLIEGAKFLAHSAFLGVALMVTTVWANRRITAKAPAPGKEPATFGDLILSSANVLFLCFGMTGVMLLVNNNLARAFAIGAAIALVRFRIKVDSKTLSMALFYGVLTGMACGVNQVVIAYPIAIFFGIFQLFIVNVARFAERKYPTAYAAPTATAGSLAAAAEALPPTAVPSAVAAAAIVPSEKGITETVSASSPAGIPTPAGLSI